MMYAPATHAAERKAWRIVIQLNLIQAVAILIDAYEIQLAHTATVNGITSGSSVATLKIQVGDPILYLRLKFAPLFSLVPTLYKWLGAVGGPENGLALGWKSELDQRKPWSEPVLFKAGWQQRVAILTKKSRSSRDSRGRPRAEGGGEEDDHSEGSGSGILSLRTPPFIRPRRQPVLAPQDERRISRGPATPTSPYSLAPTDLLWEVTASALQVEDVGELLAALRDDIAELWCQPFAQKARERGKLPQYRAGVHQLCTIQEVTSPQDQLRFESGSMTSNSFNEKVKSGWIVTDADVGRSSEASIYFLDNVCRIASRDYDPTDDDVLHARLRTVGVTEEVFCVRSRPPSVKFRVFDFGGARTQRAMWHSFFEDATAIIFVAPISAFDEVLDEDGTSCLQDSLDLFAKILCTRLLAKVSIVLLLNKADVLQKKLLGGASLSSYFSDYKDHRREYLARRRSRRPASVPSASASRSPHLYDVEGHMSASPRTYLEQQCALAYFTRKFRALLSEEQAVAIAPNRPFYVHTTVATSSKQVRAVLEDVNDALIRASLQSSGLT